MSTHILNTAMFEILIYEFFKSIETKISVCRDLLQHMQLHGVNEPEDYISKTMQGKTAQKISPVKSENKPEEVSFINVSVICNLD